LDVISIQLSYYLEEYDFIAVPTGAIEPYNYNSEISKVVGLISLKNAAYKSGLRVVWQEYITNYTKIWKYG